MNLLFFILFITQYRNYLFLKPIDVKMAAISGTKITIKSEQDELYWISGAKSGIGKEINFNFQEENINNLTIWKKTQKLTVIEPILLDNYTDCSTNFYYSKHYSLTSPIAKLNKNQSIKLFCSILFGVNKTNQLDPSYLPKATLNSSVNLIMIANGIEKLKNSSYQNLNLRYVQAFEYIAPSTDIEAFHHNGKEIYCQINHDHLIENNTDISISNYINFNTSISNKLSCRFILSLNFNPFINQSFQNSTNVLEGNYCLIVLICFLIFVNILLI